METGDLLCVPGSSFVPCSISYSFREMRFNTRALGMEGVDFAYISFFLLIHQLIHRSSSLVRHRVVHFMCDVSLFDVSISSPSTGRVPCGPSTGNLIQMPYMKQEAISRCADNPTTAVEVLYCTVSAYLLYYPSSPRPLCTCALTWLRVPVV